MTLKEFANVDSFYRDKTTGKEIEWHEYMGRVIKKLGIENIRPYIPYDIKFLKEYFDKGDVYFNTTDINTWDMAGGYEPYVSLKSQTMEYRHRQSGLSNLLYHNGITCYSPSDTVCILKEAARILCKEAT